ncbi:unnamed protein product [Fraxinus pennsylvanica]|uniref:Uncharacterized protein n=1 Tax=Fraxinus pennsylvanica TaxID=56036 RepID=A0AAD2DMY0_9LAMI|nr:unnamed protein product [Fraxinus pennsylvanica]
MQNSILMVTIGCVKISFFSMMMVKYFGLYVVPELGSESSLISTCPKFLIARFDWFVEYSKAFRLPFRPSLCVSFPYHFPRRHRYLDRRVVAELYMPVLPLRDGVGGAGAGADQSPISRHGVVYFSNPLLRIWEFS